MNVAVFSAKRYDRDFLHAANASAGHRITYFDVPLEGETSRHPPARHRGGRGFAVRRIHDLELRNIDAVLPCHDLDAHARSGEDRPDQARFRRVYGRPQRTLVTRVHDGGTRRRQRLAALDKSPVFFVIVTRLCPAALKRRPSHTPWDR